MSVDPKQQLDKTKIIGFRVIEEELQNIIIIPTMQESYQLDVVKHDTISSFVGSASIFG